MLQFHKSNSKGDNMSALTIEQKQRIEEFVEKTNKVIRTAQDIDMQEYVSKHGKFIKKFKLEIDPDAEGPFDFYKDDMADKLGIVGEVLFNVIGNAVADFADLRPYKEIDDEAWERARALGEGFSEHYLPFTLIDINSEIRNEISSSKDGEYKKTLERLTKSIDDISKTIKHEHKNLPIVFSKTGVLLGKIGTACGFQMIEGNKSEEIHKNVKKFHKFYDKLCKKTGKYQKSVNSIKLLCA